MSDFNATVDPTYVHPGFQKVYDETGEGIDLFCLFNIVDSNEEDLFEFRPSRGDKAIENCLKPKVDPLTLTDSPERKARVEALAAFYAENEEKELSAFDDERFKIRR